MTADYKSTVSLPKTDFPMKGQLPQLEPRLLQRWNDMSLFDKLRKQSVGREKFILHDGPPYANGHLHIGHALNKILKDVINRSQQMQGKDANYVPGWDCHGLPIEWKIEEKYRSAGKDKDEVPISEFRQECRQFADHWIGIQREEFIRLGVLGNWADPYTTMAFPAEAQIVRELSKFLMNGSLYKGSKAVMWSPVEKTALAEAEVEYHDHTSTTIHVRFPVETASIPEIEGASVLIWTTTPWTMPGNRAVAYGAELDYVVIRIDAVDEGGLALVGEKLICAKNLISNVCAAGKVTAHTVVAEFTGDALAGTICRHPLRGQGFDFDVPALAADFATDEEGTGIVHIAPGHGADDWELGRRNGIEPPQTVAEDGTFYDHIPLFAGKHVYKVNDEVAAVLQEAGGLLAKGKLVHRYPHSWRSKAPLIFRNASQWFISMETNGLRDTALSAIDQTRFVPQAGQKRLRSMIEQRPDWCVSRQRAWGVPITVYVSKETGEPLRDQAVQDRIAEAVAAEGADAWFDSEDARFLGNDYSIDDYEKVTDILDVWFDSGSTHSFVLEQRPDLQSPASLYLEGSDQHRGWFHSSLLESCGTRGRAPYEAVLTHGFVMAADGQKMSKSLGNVVSPQEVVDQYGADILRLWVVGSDYSEDLRIGPEIIKAQVDIYRRLRNTLRFLLGNLDGFDESQRVAVEDMPELERWALNRIGEIDSLVRKSCNEYEFHNLFVELHNFCSIDLSAFYFDIRKDVLYCDARDGLKRRAVVTVLHELFECLTAWLAPFMCFTAEEAWMTRYPNEKGSIHMRQFPEIPDSWRDEALAEKWRKIRAVRRVVTGALELERAEKRIGSSLQASPVVYVPGDVASLFDGLDAPEIFITSGVTFSTDAVPEGAYCLTEQPDVGVVAGLSEGEKCARCYRVLPDVGTHTHEAVCGRCDEAVTALEAGA
ncbi:isoleucine--tRNA ligase [Alphaproteobacteria bacterium HT1-32]|nr:isoleucine--tRNA ligase [Alphaproteobacteria bacterium HT1-32]